MNTFTKAGKTIVAITKQDWIKIGQSAGWDEERDGRSDSGIGFTLIDDEIAVTRNALNHQINIKKSSNPELIKQLEEKLRILKSKKQQLVGGVRNNQTAARARKRPQRDLRNALDL